LALLLPSHNEEIILATTIRSAIAAGQKKRDIFVVNDASTDETRKIATELLGKDNVLNVRRSGKALAVKKAIKKFDVEKEYKWLHVADADSVFSPDYFRIYRRKLSNDYAVAIGFVQSLRGNWISTYRAFSYTYGQHVFRRIQSALGMISVFPGPVTSFRTDILSKLEIHGRNVTEDFDITLQVHRKKLGRIVYIPKAINYTQDPQTFKDFCKQSVRWYTGFFQGIQEHRIGLRKQRIDIGIGLQLLQTVFFLVQVLVLFPIILIQTHHWMAIPLAISIDFILTSIITIFSAAAIRRWTMLGVLPYFYFLRLTELAIYFTAFFKVLALRRYEGDERGWATKDRRYKIAAAAMQDVAG
jgi:cellulose synthase/poly-beta-1,6-N-acetylglucosamine synthase-like glycosyltransferase